MTRSMPITDTVTLHVPFRIVRRGGRKEMQLPEGAAQSQRTDNTLVKALARAFRWKRMLESGDFATIAAPVLQTSTPPSRHVRFLEISAGTAPTTMSPRPIQFSGFSVSFISDLENGKTTAELGKAIYLANLLGLDCYLTPRS